MPRGTQDWQKATDIVAQTIENLNVNINAQTVERVIEAPSYGGAREVQSSTTIYPGQNPTVLSVEGKGIVYGGFLDLRTSTSPNYVFVTFAIDGETFSGFKLDAMDDYNIRNSDMYYAYLVTYDTANGKYQLALKSRITFDSYYKVIVGVLSGASDNVSFNGVLIYALRA